MAKQFDEVMARSIKGLSFFDLDGLDTDEYSKLSSIINTSNKSSGVELLFEDEDSIENNDEDDNNNDNEVDPNNDKEVNTSNDNAVGAKNDEDVVKEVIVEAEISEEKKVATPQCEEKEPEKVCVVDVENSVLQPSAPVFRPSIPPPSMMPFPIAVPHWAPHHHPHADPNMPHPAHQHHHHQPQAGPYSYALPGGYVFHSHDPSLGAATHHHPHGHSGEPTTVPCFVTLSNGHQPHQSAYAFPGHHQHIPAHYPFQSNTLAAAPGLPSPMSHAAAHHHPHHAPHHAHHHIPSQGDILHSMSNNGVIPTTPSHHHSMGFPPHSAVGRGQQPLPAHIVPPHTMSHHQPTTMPHHHRHHNQQHTTQFMYVHQEPQQQDTPSTSVSSPATEEGGGDASVCANSNDVETNSETSPKLSHGEKKETKPQNNDNQSGAILKKENESPSKFTLSEIEFGGPVVFDTEPQPTSNSSIEKTPTKSPTAKSRTKKSPLPLSPQTAKSAPSPSKKDKSSTPSKPKHKTGSVVKDNNLESNRAIDADCIHIDNNKDKSIVNTNQSSNVNAIMQSSHVNKEIAKPTKASSSSTSSQPVGINPTKPSNKPSVNKKNTSPPDVNSLPSVNSSAAKEELSPPEVNKISKEVSEDKSDSDNKPQQPASVAAPAPVAPKSWSSLFGKQASSVPLQVTSSTVSEQQTVVSSLEAPKTSVPAVIPATSVRHWQEQERHRGKERSDLSPGDNIKAVGVKQDPLAPKLLARLSNVPISYIPIIVQPRGLKNGRNICFMNATLQVLMGCPPFIHLFRAFRNLPARTGGNSSTPVFDSLVQFVNSFHHCQRTKQEGPMKKGSGYAINVGVPFIPESLLGVAQHILGLNIGVQHDAEEFLSQILSICNEEVERIIKMNNMDTLNNNSAATVGKNVIGNGNHYQQNGDINSHADENNEDDGDGSWVQVGPKNYCVETNVNNCGQTPLSAIFAGLSRSTLVRDSGKTSDTVDSFFTLKLDIQTDNVHSVRDALVRLNATEDVHDVDGTKVKGHRRMFFDELPPVLIMHLKLFKYSNGIGQKIQKNISFDVHLQIPKELMSRFGRSKYHSSKSRSYKLFGVVNHHGTKMDDGHYTSDVFLPIVNGWVHFDDTKVSPSDEATVLKHVDKSMPYLLFYRRVDV